jgi:hypothetical protein
VVRDLSAERGGLRLPNGARLRVARVKIFLSEEPAEAPAAPAATTSPEQQLARPQMQQSGCGGAAGSQEEAMEGTPAAAAAASADDTEAAGRKLLEGSRSEAEGGSAVEMSDVLRRLAAAEVAIAQHHNKVCSLSPL